MARHLHNRQLDHTENDLDTNIEIDGDIGAYLSGTILHDVLTGLDAAINSGASAGRVKVSSNDTTLGYLLAKIVGGANVTVTEGNDGGNEFLTIAANSGGGGGGGWVTDGTDGVALETGRNLIYDQNSDALIFFDAEIDLVPTPGEDIRLETTTTGRILITGGSGIVLPELSGDPASPTVGQIYYNDFDNKFRGRITGAWVDLNETALPPPTFKLAVRVATTADITIATALNSGDSIDGVTLASGDRVLVKNQSTGSQNGIYVVAGSPFRATDMDESAEAAGTVVFVSEGTAGADSLWYLATNAPITIGTTALSFLQYRALATTASPTIVPSGASAGTSLEVARQDHNHTGAGLRSAVAPTVSAPGDTAATGSSLSLANRDHLHGRESFALAADLSAQAFGDAAAAGAGTKVPRADHKHAMPASPVPAGTTLGDLLVWNGSAWVVIPAGANGTVLTADSAEPLGIKWA